MPTPKVQSTIHANGVDIPLSQQLEARRLHFLD